jgi:hypothetical protein
MGLYALWSVGIRNYPTSRNHYQIHHEDHLLEGSLCQAQLGCKRVSSQTTEVPI